jgi:hypothetical protein
MDGLQFTSSVIHSLAWPTAAVGSVLLLRRPLTKALSRPLRDMEVGPGGVKLSWWSAATRVREELTAGAGAPAGEPLATTEFAREMLGVAEQGSPIGAVVASEGRIASQLRGLLGDEPDVERLNTAELAVRARERGLINDQTLNAVEGLTVMHTMAILDDGGVGLDMAKAREFIGLSEGVLYALRSGPRT